MNPLAAVLSQDWVGEILFGVQGLFLPPLPGSEQPILAGVALRLGGRTLVVQTDPVEPIIHLQEGPFRSLVGVSSHETDLSQHEPFHPFLHCPLYSWWLLENEFGSVDGVMLAFDRLHGLILLALNNELSIVPFHQPG